MPVTAVIGTQWGDEGKGKIVDLLAEDADLVIRFNGGNNAGHTIKNEHTESMKEGVAKLHIVPSGIFNPDTIPIIGTGTVVHLPTLVQELNELQDAGVDISKLLISRKAPLIMPWHLVLDEAQEEQRKREENKEEDSDDSQGIGTTRRGIGPVYARKHERYGLRVEDLLLSRDKLLEKLQSEWNYYKELLNKVYKHEPELFGDGNYSYFLERDAEQIRDYIADTESVAWEALKAKKNILLEGAQAVLLDIDHGTYPYVTSSSAGCGVAAAIQGAGIPWKSIDEVIGVVKAYITRVGAGGFPTRMDPETDELVRKLGNEKGATTGRSRMCGWLDMPLLKYAHNLNAFTSLAITKLDILTQIPSVKVGLLYFCQEESRGSCSHYYCGFKDAEPFYRPFQDWEKYDISEVKKREDLPQSANHYIEFIETSLGVPARFISVGPDRDQTIRCLEL